MEFQKIEIDSNSPTSVGGTIYYECTLCNERIFSLPRNAGSCGCKNIRIDSDAGRISIKNYENILLLKLVGS